MEEKKDVTKELTESHIDALYEAMDELIYERFEAIEVLRGDLVVLMIMAFGAADRQTEKHRSNGAGHFTQQHVTGFHAPRLSKRRQPQEREPDHRLGVGSR